MDEAGQRADLVRDVSYRIILDLTGEDDFGSESIVRFGCARPGGETFLDFTAPTVSSIELNGRTVPLEAFDGNRIHLTRLAGSNEVRVLGRCAYHRTELGMHRFVDPADGNVYLHTDFEPFDAHRVFACFD
ncbi:MAG TPA: aminopeptidase N, partial [Actinomycetota bacterium]